MPVEIKFFLFLFIFCLM